MIQQVSPQTPLCLRLEGALVKEFQETSNRLFKTLSLEAKLRLISQLFHLPRDLVTVLPSSQAL